MHADAHAPCTSAGSTFTPDQLTPDQLTLLSLVSDTPPASIFRPDQGVDNDVVIVDDRWVVRVAATEAARGYLVNELAVLAALPGDLRVPRPLGTHTHGVVYELLVGHPLDRATWTSLGADRQTVVALQLSLLLASLHAVDCAALSNPLPPLTANWVRGSIERCMATTPRRALSFPVEALHARFEAAWSLAPPPPLTVVHQDLKPVHLLVDENEVVSVIDFGAVGIGEPALDLGVLVHHLGDDLLVAMGIEHTPAAARARCWADLYELRRCTRGWSETAPRSR